VSKLTIAVALAVAWVIAPRLAQAGGAVDTVAREAGQSLGAVPPASLVVAAPLASDQAVTKGDELALRVAALVAGRIGPSARASSQTAQLATARALAGRASALVFVQSEIAKGDLRATVDVYPAMANAWDRIRNPLPAPMAHAFATAKLDAEVRAFLTPLVLELSTVHRFKHDEGDVLAAGCGDVDGDGGNEVVLVSRGRVAIGRVRAGAFVAEHAAPWASLGPRLPVPMREPLGGAVIMLGAVDAGTTDRGGVALTPDLAGHIPLAGVPVPAGDGPVCLIPQPSAGAFDGAPIDCSPSRDPKPKMAVPSPRYDALAAASVVDAQGSEKQVVVAREPSGKLRVRIGEATPNLEGAFGAQLAAGDLDQDGLPDVATTLEGAEDAVNVFSAAPSGELRGRLHLAAPAGVRALAMCPPEANGKPVLLAVVGGELWLIRAGEPLVADVRDGAHATPPKGAR
jgi:hypothetical protein